MKASKLFCLCLLLGATSAQSQESNLYPVNTTVRDYAKRDRLLLGSLDYLSPSQLHENMGMRARLGTTVQNSQLRKQGVGSNLQTPTVAAAAVYGWQDFTLGVKGSYTDAEIKTADATPFEEDFTVRTVTPEVAYTFGKYFTVGGAVEVTNFDLSENAVTDREFSYNYNRGIAGLSYHEPEFEIGVAYTTEIQESDIVNAASDRPATGLTLAPTTANPSERAVYLPSTGTAFVRGNLSDNFSLASSVSMARYDGNVDGAVPLFEQYKSADRVASRLVASYWTDARSRISAAAEYKGAASSEIGTEETGLGYRLANLYGGSLEGVLAVNRKAYFGLNASFMRGERGDTLNATGDRFTAREESARYSGFVTVKL